LLNGKALGNFDLEDDDGVKRTVQIPNTCTAKVPQIACYPPNTGVNRARYHQEQPAK